MKPIYLVLFYLAFVTSGCKTPEKPPAAKVHLVQDLVSLPEPLHIMADKLAAETGIDPDIGFALLMKESRFDESALSKTNAVGIAQVLRSTARSECKIKKLTDLAKDKNNIRCGFQYLSKLTKLMGSERLALMAYNIGAENVKNPKRDPEKYKEAKIYAEWIMKKARG